MKFNVKDSDLKLEIFTTRPDTIFGVSFMVLAPESDYVKPLTTPEQANAVAEYLDYVSKRTERERQTDVKKVTGVFTGSYAINPFTNEAIPIWISEYVLSGYGTGAIMAVPGHDSRDYAFAKHFNLPIIPVIDDGEGHDMSEGSYDAKVGKMINSGIINGMGKGTFMPNKTMTRAEFAAIVTRALGLAAKDTKVFTDVPSSKWYAGYIGTANSSGIVNGVGSGKFNPDGTITRQEAAAMVARAAKLCGLDTAMGAAATKDMLAQFGDYRSVASWAKEPMAFCYSVNILDQSDLNIEPTKAILRCEIAQMLYNMLTAAELI